MSEFKSGFVAIVGRPNVGKSTLLNHLTGEKVAIVSNKPQTTRNKILAIYNDKNSQIVFVDTPGVHKAQTRLGTYMNKTVNESVQDVDAILFVVEAGREALSAEKDMVKELFGKNVPVILVINKVDMVNKETILPQISEFNEMGNFHSIIPVSALKNNGIDRIKEVLVEIMPIGPKFYPEDMITDQTERQMVSEIIREKILRTLDKEVPHGIAVEIEKMDEGETLTKISAVVYCEKSSHKAIVIGKNGEMLKRIGSYARNDIEKLLGVKVYLQLWVKVKDDWRNNNFMLKSFGYEG